MVGLLSGECILPRVIIAYFDVNVGYVFNQVFCLVGASCARDLFRVGGQIRNRSLSVGASVFARGIAWVFLRISADFLALATSGNV